MGDRLISLIYVSSATEAFNPDQVIDLLRISRENNQRDQITGMLLYKGGSFMQVLEGPEDNVLHRYDKIRNDPRHQDVFLISVQPIRTREFRSWEMGFTNLDQIDVATLPNYTPFLEEDFSSDDFIYQPSRAKLLLSAFKEGLG
jgi:hypothetical protein